MDRISGPTTRMDSSEYFGLNLVTNELKGDPSGQNIEYFNKKNEGI